MADSDKGICRYRIKASKTVHLAAPSAAPRPPPCPPSPPFSVPIDGDSTAGRPLRSEPGSIGDRQEYRRLLLRRRRRRRWRSSSQYCCRCLEALFATAIIHCSLLTRCRICVYGGRGATLPGPRCKLCSREGSVGPRLGVGAGVGDSLVRLRQLNVLKLLHLSSGAESSIGKRAACSFA